jgi:hypothetical protein
MTTIGYARVSIQEEALKAAGCEVKPLNAASIAG